MPINKIVMPINRHVMPINKIVRKQAGATWAKWQCGSLLSLDFLGVSPLGSPWPG